MLPVHQFATHQLIENARKCHESIYCRSQIFIGFNLGQIWWPVIFQGFLRFLEAEARQNLRYHGIPDCPGFEIDHGATEFWSVAKPKENACCLPGIVPLHKEFHQFLRVAHRSLLKMIQKLMIFMVFQGFLYQKH